MNSSSRIIALGLLMMLLIAGIVYETIFISETKTEVSALVAEAASLSGNSGTAQSIRAIKNDSVADLATLDAAAITRPELASFMGVIEQAGKDAGVIVSISSVKDEAGSLSSTTPQAVRIVLDTTGSWAGNLSFVRMMGSLPHKASVENASVSLTSKGWKGGVTLRLAIFPEKL